jgi:hypothetical protein
MVGLARGGLLMLTLRPVLNFALRAGMCPQGFKLAHRGEDPFILLKSSVFFAWGERRGSMFQL